MLQGGQVEHAQRPAGLRALQQSAATAKVTVVTTAQQLQDAVWTGAAHIEVQAHLDLTSEHIFGEEPDTPDTVLSIRVRCFVLLHADHVVANAPCHTLKQQSTTIIIVSIDILLVVAGMRRLPGAALQRRLIFVTKCSMVIGTTILIAQVRAGQLRTRSKEPGEGACRPSPFAPVRAHCNSVT